MTFEAVRLGDTCLGDTVLEEADSRGDEYELSFLSRSCTVKKNGSPGRRLSRKRYGVRYGLPAAILLKREALEGRSA